MDEGPIVEVGCLALMGCGFWTLVVVGVLWLMGFLTW